MIYTLTMNPAIDKTVTVDTLTIGGLNRIQNVKMHAGGKGINVSKMIHHLRAKSVAFGVVAGNSGAFIEKELDSLGIEHDFIHVEGNTRTNLKVLDHNHIITELNESGPLLQETDIEQVTQKLMKCLRKEDVLIISGSVPNGVSTAYYYELVKQAKMKKATIILDADGDLFKEGIKAIPTIIKPNIFELCQYFNVKEDIKHEEIVKLTRTFIHQGVRLAIVSMGAQGALFVTQNEAVYTKALPVQVYSSVGAGDAMVGALADAIQRQESFDAIVRIVMASSAAAVEFNHVGIIELKRIDQLKRQVEMTHINV